MQKLFPPIFVLLLSIITFPAFAYTTPVNTTSAGTPISPMPQITHLPCIPRPACLDAKPHCMIAEPAEGFCKPTPTTTRKPAQVVLTVTKIPAKQSLTDIFLNIFKFLLRSK